jgi:endogenous inhibitor of DNA gyrase (YacG/DUF329 family)
MKCLICKKEVVPGSRHAPFCSKRCQLIDLGNWATEKYRITTPAQPEDLDKEREEDDEREE